VLPHGSALHSPACTPSSINRPPRPACIWPVQRGARPTCRFSKSVLWYYLLSGTMHAHAAHALSPAMRAYALYPPPPTHTRRAATRPTPHGADRSSPTVTGHRYDDTTLTQHHHPHPHPPPATRGKLPGAHPAKCSPFTKTPAPEHDVSTGQSRFPEHNGLPRRGLLGGTSGWGPSTGELGRSGEPVVGSSTHLVMPNLIMLWKRVPWNTLR
jgi:hypothetical protein